MARKIRLLSLFAAVLAVVALVAGDGSADTVSDDACEQNYPCNITDFDTFVDNQCEVCGEDGLSDCFNEDTVAPYTICEEIPEFDFEKLWYVVAIATESSRVNSVQDTDGNIIFSKNDCTRWGLYSVIDFDSSNNLRFHDGISTVDLDPYVGSDRFRVCQLTQDSNVLGYLANPTKLRKGDLIVGFEDWTDGDNDDLIVALRALNTKANPRFVIEKDGTKEVFDGGEFHFVWTDNITCEADVYYCEPGQAFPGDCDQLTGDPISIIEDEDAVEEPEQQAVFFGTEGGTCKPVYIKFGNFSKRCAIVGGKKYCR